MLNMMMSGGLGGMMSQMAQGGGMPGAAAAPGATAGSAPSFGSQLQVDKVKAQIEARIEAEAQRERTRLPALEARSGPQIEVMDDEVKTPAVPHDQPNA
jgi:hypothetical protein